MIKKKICMLGSFAVGKTSLVQQYVKSVFSEKYHTTIGVKIDKKTIFYQQQEVNLLLWDIHGEDEYQKIQPSYLLGASGYFLVIDGTRAATLDIAFRLNEIAQKTLPNRPFILLINKADIEEIWEIDENLLAEAQKKGWKVIKTSAKTGQGVEEAFFSLTQMMLDA